MFIWQCPPKSTTHNIMCFLSELDSSNNFCLHAARIVCRSSASISDYQGLKPCLCFSITTNTAQVLCQSMSTGYHRAQTPIFNPVHLYAYELSEAWTLSIELTYLNISNGEESALSLTGDTETAVCEFEVTNNCSASNGNKNV